jgi:hypothetical protein
MVLSTPEAIPSSSRSTADRAAFAVGAKKSDIPTPAIRKGIASSQYETVGLLIAASHARATAVNAVPATTSLRLPM